MWPIPTYVYFTMIDWEGTDTDGDGLFDEDKTVDGTDQDGDGLDGEDPVEPHPGLETKAIDCDAKGDGVVSIQIRDTQPEKGIISTQEWWLRLIGKPEQNFAFTTYANQLCETVFPAVGDPYVQCTGGPSDWVLLGYFNAMNPDPNTINDTPCVKQVKLGGKNPSNGGGKTPFCDITKGFLVDAEVDTDGDGIPDTTETDQYVFGFVTCFDDPATTTDESASCPLSSIVWEIDPNETTSKAKAQIFVSHTGQARIRSGKIK